MSDNPSALERRCLDRANGTWITLDEDHTLAIVKAVLAEAGVAELVEALRSCEFWSREKPNGTVADLAREQAHVHVTALAALAKIGATQ